MADTEEKDLSCYYLWFDTEFTSLNLEDSRLLQVAMVMTDSRLKRITPPEDDINLFVRIEPDFACDTWVEENLGELLSKCRSEEAISIEEIDVRLTDLVDRVLGPTPREKVSRPVLAGNSLHSDWYLCRKFLPSLITRLNYRLLDVTSWKLYWKNSLGKAPFDKDSAELIQQYLPDGFAVAGKQHDAHFDVLASIAEMSFYESHLKAT